MAGLFGVVVCYGCFVRSVGVLGCCRCVALSFDAVHFSLQSLDLCGHFELQRVVGQQWDLSIPEFCT